MQEKYIQIKAFINNICAADDMNFHSVEFNFEMDAKLKNTIEIVEQHKEYKGYSGGIWVGTETNYKLIRANNGKWKINKDVNLNDFFQNIQLFIRFVRGSIKYKV